MISTHGGVANRPRVIWDRTIDGLLFPSQLSYNVRVTPVV